MAVKMDEQYELKSVNNQDAMEVTGDRMKTITDRDNATLARLGKKAVLKV